MKEQAWHIKNVSRYVSPSNRRAGDFEQPRAACDYGIGDIYRTASLLLDSGIDPNRRDLQGMAACFDAGVRGLYPFIKAMADSTLALKFKPKKEGNLSRSVTLC
jgi:hypothetical protein